MSRFLCYIIGMFIIVLIADCLNMRELIGVCVGVAILSFWEARQDD